MAHSGEFAHLFRLRLTIRTSHSSGRNLYEAVFELAVKGSPRAAVST
jgi:hypothetical protein